MVVEVWCGTVDSRDAESPLSKEAILRCVFRNVDLSAGTLVTTTATRSAATATVLAREVATALTVGAVALKATTATRSTVTTVVGAVGVASTNTSSLRATRLDDDVLAVNNVRVAGNGSLVSLNGLVLDKGAVLHKVVSQHRVICGISFLYVPSGG